MDKIAIINLKGGVGKSVTACNLAAELAAKSLAVLVVDLDKQGNTSKFFGTLDYDRPSVVKTPRKRRWSVRPARRRCICCPAICGC